MLARLSCGGAAGGAEDTHAPASCFIPSRCSLPASAWPGGAGSLQAALTAGFWGRTARLQLVSCSPCPSVLSPSSAPREKLLLMMMRPLVKAKLLTQL